MSGTFFDLPIRAIPSISSSTFRDAFLNPPRASLRFFDRPPPSVTFTFAQFVRFLLGLL
jgi:hypothetical protein